MATIWQGKKGKTGWNPTKETQELLDWGLQRVQGVPFKVSARWLFYRFVQEKGFGKHQYKALLNILSKARKTRCGGWRPDILADETRQMIKRGFGYSSVSDWIEHFNDETCVLDKYDVQDYTVQIWFEAEAMISQFEHYTESYHVSLVPFKGQASIPYKYEIAKHLEYLSNTYGKPIVILYFGDYDKYGLEIPNNALKDIRRWCRARFEFIRCGINQEHIQRYNLIDNPEKPGTYQWEALGEEAARELILDNLERYWSLEIVKQVEEAEDKATSLWSETLDDLMKDVDMSTFGATKEEIDSD